MFSLLPRDLCVSLLSLLDHRSLCSFSRTCRACHGLSSDPRLWRHVSVPCTLSSVRSFALSLRPAERVDLAPALHYDAPDDGLASCVAELASSAALRESLASLHVLTVLGADDAHALGPEALAALATMPGLRRLGLRVLEEAHDALRALCSALGQSLVELRVDGPGSGVDTAALLGLADCAMATGPLQRLERLDLKITDLSALHVLLASCCGLAPVPALREVSRIDITEELEARGGYEGVGHMLSREVGFAVLLGAMSPVLEDLDVTGLNHPSLLHTFGRLRALKSCCGCRGLQYKKFAVKKKLPSLTQLEMPDCLCR
eukprot:m51a1_g5741 hypothetical protein (318) ;mRNA; r:1163408-1164361